MSDDLIFAISNSPLMVTVVGAKPVLWFPSPCCNRACCADVTVLLILKPGESYRSFDVMPGSTSLARRYRGRGFVSFFVFIRRRRFWLVARRRPRDRKSWLGSFDFFVFVFETIDHCSLSLSRVRDCGQKPARLYAASGRSCPGGSDSFRH